MSEPLDTDMPEIIEREDFLWEVKLPNGKLLENPQRGFGTSFAGYQSAENAALCWWICRLTNQFKPKVSRQ